MAIEFRNGDRVIIAKAEEAPEEHGIYVSPDINPDAHIVLADKAHRVEGDNGLRCIWSKYLSKE